MNSDEFFVIRTLGEIYKSGKLDRDMLQAAVTEEEGHGSEFVQILPESVGGQYHGLFRVQNPSKHPWDRDDHGFSRQANT